MAHINYLNYYMQLRIVLEAQNHSTTIPINYQYPLSAWVYQALEQGNPQEANFLHQEGYVSGHRRFKLYAFSELRTPGAKVKGDRLMLKQKELWFDISFLADRTAMAMAMGVFQQSNTFWLGDRKSGGQFSIRSVQMKPLPDLKESTTFFTVSPVVISKSDIGVDGKAGKKYLSPEDKGYAQQLIDNLLHKYKVAQVAGLMDTSEDVPELCFELLSHHSKEKHINLMSGQAGFTRVRAYKYRFRLSGHSPLLRLALLAGVGEKNAMGFGALEVRKEER